MIQESINKTNLIFNEIAGKITSTDNIDSIANLVLDLSINLTYARNASILLVDADNNLSVKAARGIDPELISTILIKNGDGISGQVAKKRIPFFVKDITSDKRITKKGNGKYKTGSFISCPITLKEKLFGVINIADKSDNTSFTDNDFEIITILAGQTAISLEHANLMTELRTKSTELEKRNESFIAAESFKSKFMSRITHDLRTPLNSITGAVFYLKEKECKEKEQKEFINIISEETRKLIQLLHGLLNFSFIDKKNRSHKKTVLNLKEIMHDAAESLVIKNKLLRNRLSIRINCKDNIPVLAGDKAYLVQAFINLIDGISKYASAGDCINVDAFPNISSIEIDLSIMGKTIPESELPFIFNERALWSGINAAKDNLNFYLAKENITLHDGSVSVTNTKDGIKISLLFPVNTKNSRDAEIGELLDIFLSFTSETMASNRCSFMWVDELTGELTIRSAIGLYDDIIQDTRLKTGERIAGLAALKNKPLLIKDLEKNPDIAVNSNEQYNTKSLLCIPVAVNNKVIGVLNINNKADAEPFNEKDLQLAIALTERLSHIIDKVQTGKLINGEVKTLINDMEMLLHIKKNYSKDRKLTDLVYGIAQNIKCSEHEARLALYVSHFYDVGLAQIDDSIISKTGKLSSIEQMIIKTHPYPGAGFMKHLETDDTATKSILHHHERYDGSGYPDGLKGDDIPLISRILSVADSYTAMITDRPYKKSINQKEAIEEISACAGTQFDPEIVKAFKALPADLLSTNTL